MVPEKSISEKDVPMMKTNKNNKNMKYHLQKAKNAEDILFYLGIFVGLFILTAGLINSKSLPLAIPASFFGFSATIPKIRRILFAR